MSIPSINIRGLRHDIDNILVDYYKESSKLDDASHEITDYILDLLNLFDVEITLEDPFQKF